MYIIKLSKTVIEIYNIEGKWKIKRNNRMRDRLLARLKSIRK